MNDFKDIVSIEAHSEAYGVPLGTMRQILQISGFNFSLEPSLRGISGTLQCFDIVARKGNQTIVIDVLPSADRKKSEMKLINMRAKIWDCAPDLAIAISPVEASKEMKEMAKFYKLALIVAMNEQDLEEKFEQLVNSLN